MSEARLTAIIVDGYSSGAQVAPLCRAIGMHSVHVSSLRSVPEYYTHSFRSSDYIQEIPFTERTKQIVEALRSRKVTFVVPGLGCSVALANTLADRLCGRPNLASVERCIDKFQQIQAFRANDLAPDLPTLMLSELRQIDSELANWSHYPAIVKPCYSDGSVGVTMCRDRTDVVSAATRWMQRSRDIYGRVAHAGGLVVQPYITGIEYTVNLTSIDGHAQVHSAWHSVKRYVNGHLLRDYLESVSSGPDAEIALHASRLAARVLGVRNGPSNADIIVTGGRANCLEVNCRLAGSLEPFAYVALGQDTPAFRMAVSYLCRKAVSAEHPASSRMVRVVSVAAGGRSVPEIEMALRTRPTLSSNWYFSRNASEDVVHTEDLRTMVGNYYLDGSSPEEINRDTDAIRKWEAVHLLL